MIDITYLIKIYNQEKYIPALVTSLKSLNSNLSKEFIFIDDGSVDDSIGALQKQTANLPRTMIIKQERSGSAALINRALYLAHGTYIHFVEGHDALDPDASELMLKACNDLGVDVAYGLLGTYNQALKECEQNKNESHTYRFIESPISAILLNKDIYIRNIGGSGTMVKKSLLERIDGSDSSIYVHDVALALRCAKFSKFAFVLKTVSYSQLQELEKVDKHFRAHNILQSIYNFIENNKEIAEQYKPELYKTLHVTLRILGTRRIINSIKALMPKYAARKMDINRIISLYKTSINKLI